jgi:hypothetical protein
MYVAPLLDLNQLAAEQNKQINQIRNNSVRGVAE